MKIFQITFLLLFLAFLFSCGCKDNCVQNIEVVGAKCYDGTLTLATDSLACLNNGNVENWLFENNCDTYTRVGAICKDGTISTAIGSGACSHHGGVDFWLCIEEEEKTD